MSDSFFITMNANKVCIHTFGTGPGLLIAFHGFKEGGSYFSVLEKTLDNKFTIYAPDLPFHGNTEWSDPYFNTGDLTQLINTLLHHFGTTRFTLLGYSLGGRVALCAMSIFFQQTEALILLAPDGLKVNPWYYFVTYTKIGHALFHYVTYHPAIFKFIIETGYKLSLTNESIYKFVRLHTDEEAHRVLVYRIWTSMKNLYPDIPEIKRLIRRDRLPVIVFFGKYDRIFPPKYGKIFKDIPSARILAVDFGHQLLKQKVGEEIFRYLNQNSSRI